MLIMQNKNDLIIFKNLETEKSNNKMCVVKRQKSIVSIKALALFFLWMRLLLLIFWHKCSVMFTILIYGGSEY